MSATANARAGRAAAILVPLDRCDREPLHRQIYTGLRAAILAGRLAPGLRIPSSRALAADLGVSRTTVLLAYDQLQAEGYLATRPAAGTQVAVELPEDMLHARPPARAQPAVRRGTRLLSPRSRGLLSPARGAVRLGPAPRAFRVGTPALDCFPIALWSRLVARRQRRIGPALLDYGDPGGFRPLREAIAAHVGAARGAPCDADQVIVVAGAQQGLEFAVRMLLEPGEEAWIEDPGYPGARHALRSAGAAVVPVPVDGEGLDVEHGTRVAPRARLVYVTPSHQYPLGVCMSVARRLELLRWARRSRAWILEDDYDSEFRYAGRPVAALHGLDQDGRVLYVGTFSKALFPALRLGFLIAPRALVGPLLEARSAVDQHAPQLEQSVLADFLAGGHFARHVRRMRGLYLERRDALGEAVARFCAPALAVRPTESGLHAVADLAQGLDDRAVAAAAAAQGVEVAPLSAYTWRSSAARGLVLGFAAVDTRSITEGMRRLALALENVRR